MAEDPEDPSRHATGVSRRGFIATVGTGAVAAAAVAKAGAESPQGAQLPEGAEMVRVALDVNGRTHRLLVEPRWSLLYVLRERLGLTGSKLGCERGECGVCTVLVDDQPQYSCMMLAVEAEGRRITTVEGLMRGEELGPVQQAFVEEDAFQCGYCTPGQVMAVEGLLRARPAPTPDEIRQGVSGNLCRCGAYAHIFKAAERASVLKKQEGGRG
ncbi:MAG TPA: (2Fe-2S)-binding protein [Vicinamibacterales bacterium]|nr:(2Fe-2S)-binding protein [Vicinamibacterales bacterium]